MKVLLLGKLAETAGRSVIETDAFPDIDSLRKELLMQFPALKEFSFQIAVNKEKIEKNIPLNDDDEIALLPAFAGG